MKLHGYYYQFQIEKLIKVPKVKSEKENYDDLVFEVIEYFNQARRNAGISNQPLKITFQRKQMILYRLKEKVGINDIKRVIYTKFKDWAKNPQMKKYLTPETLFRPSNFTKYLDEANAITAEDWTQTDKKEIVKTGQSELSWT